MSPREEPWFRYRVSIFLEGFGGNCMVEVIEQVMRTYALMVTLTPAEEQAARERLGLFLKDKSDDTRQLAVEGVKFLRGDRTSRTRRA
jgi:hypothetical protein